MIRFPDEDSKQLGTKSGKPTGKIGRDILVLAGLIRRDPSDLFGLARRKHFMGIETTGRGQQALTPQDFVHTGDTARELMSDIEDRCVSIGERDVLGEPLCRNR